MDEILYNQSLLDLHFLEEKRENKTALNLKESLEMEESRLEDYKKELEMLKLKLEDEDE